MIAKDYLEYYLNNIKNELIKIEKFVNPEFIIQAKIQINPIIDGGLTWLQENNNSSAEIYNNKQIELSNIINPLIQTIFVSGLQPGRLMSPIYYNQNTPINIIKYYLYDLIITEIRLQIDNIIDDTINWLNQNTNADTITCNNKLTELIHLINPIKKQLNNPQIPDIKVYLFNYKNMLTKRADQIQSLKFDEIKAEADPIIEEGLTWLEENSNIDINSITYKNKQKELKNKLNPLKQKLFTILSS